MSTPVVVGASVLARPVHPILPNRRERANVAMRQGFSSALDSWTRAWVLRRVYHQPLGQQDKRDLQSQLSCATPVGAQRLCLSSPFPCVPALPPSKDGV